MLSAMLNKASPIATVYAEEEKHLVRPEKVSIPLVCLALVMTIAKPLDYYLLVSF